MRSEPLSLALIISLLLHMGVVLVLPNLAKQRIVQQTQVPITVAIIEPPSVEEKTTRTEDIRPEMKTPAPPGNVAKLPAAPRATRDSIPPGQPTAPSAPREEPPATAATKPAATSSETTPGFASDARDEGARSPSDAANSSGNGNVGVAAGSGNAGVAGTPGLGVGSDSATAGSPGSSASIGGPRREAKPVHTVRANYPPMALRMGLEGDVNLKIGVDAEGKVTKAEIIKSGGAGFDEEALKAVAKARFEPARKDGQNVAAEFTYIYRFRLQR